MCATSEVDAAAAASAAAASDPAAAAVTSTAVPVVLGLLLPHDLHPHLAPHTSYLSTLNLAPHTSTAALWSAVAILVATSRTSPSTRPS